MKCSGHNWSLAITADAMFWNCKQQCMYLNFYSFIWFFVGTVFCHCWSLHVHTIMQLFPAIMGAETLHPDWHALGHVHGKHITNFFTHQDYIQSRWEDTNWHFITLCGMERQHWSVGVAGGERFQQRKSSTFSHGTLDAWLWSLMLKLKQVNFSSRFACRRATTAYQCENRHADVLM